jgi:hypothetical protein
MSVCQKIDRMLAGMAEEKIKPEYIIMGREYCAEWLREIARQGDLDMKPGAKKYKFSYKNIPVIVCYSGILEIVPNAKKML